MTWNGGVGTLGRSWRFTSIVTRAERGDGGTRRRFARSISGPWQRPVRDLPKAMWATNRGLVRVRGRSSVLNRHSGPDGQQPIPVSMDVAEHPARLHDSVTPESIELHYNIIVRQHCSPTPIGI